MCEVTNFEMWVIYDKPKDFPDKYVARKWIVDEKPVPTGEVLTGNTLNEIRTKLPRDLYKVNRSPWDDACIVETWV